MAGDESMPALTTNFFDMIQVETSADFANMINYFVTNYLNNEALTLNSLFASVEEGSFLATIYNFYQSLSAITINECAIVANLTTNASNTDLAGISLTATADITMGEVTFSVDASASLTFSAVGTTTITAPTISDDTVEKSYLTYYFEDDDLTAGTELVIQNVQMGSCNIIYVPSYDQTTTLVYNSTNHTLTLSAGAVDYIRQNSMLTFGSEDYAHFCGIYYSVSE
jgi:hypothetical protein